MFGWGENREDGKQRRKIGWKTLFSLFGKRRKMLRMENSGENSLPGPQFSSSQIGRKIVERKVLSQHFYRNALTTTNTTIFLSNISKLKHNQIIRIQIQKHNFKINQIITIKTKKKTKDRRQKPSDPFGLRWGRR